MSWGKVNTALLLLIYFPIWLWYAKKGQLYITTMAVSSMVGPRSSKVMPEANLAPKGYGHGDSHYSFLNPGKKIFMSQMCVLSKSTMYTQTCNPCSLHRPAERAQFSSTATPDCTSHNQTFKSWINWAMNFTSSTLLTWPFTHHPPPHQGLGEGTSTTSCRENTSTARMQEIFSTSLSNHRV